MMQALARNLRLALAIPVAISICGIADAQDRQDVGVPDELDAVTNAGLDPQREVQSASDRIIVPVPFVTPQIGVGLAVAGAWFYQPDQDSRPWASGIGALFTSNGSRGIAGLQKMSLHDDRLRVDVLAGYGRIRRRYYAVDASSQVNDGWVEAEEKTVVLSATARLRIAEKFFVGGRARHLSKLSRARDQSDPPPAFDERRFDVDVAYLQLAPILTIDTTADAFAPREGSILNAQWTFASAVRGEGEDYNKKQGYARQYIPGKGRSSAAIQIKGCSASSGAPFFDLCPIGLRGYPDGRFRDRSSWAAEAEWRQPVSRRFGLVGFVGIGSLGSDFGDALEGDMLPVLGAGVRYLAAESYGINLRIDGAIGQDSSAIYVSIGEAF